MKFIEKLIIKALGIQDYFEDSDDYHSFHDLINCLRVESNLLKDDIHVIKENYNSIICKYTRIMCAQYYQMHQNAKTMAMCDICGKHRGCAKIKLFNPVESKNICRQCMHTYFLGSFQFIKKEKPKKSFKKTSKNPK